MSRRLIVNADDFGQTTGINRGVIRAYEDGIVTSASLMVRWPSADEAAAYARVTPALSVGLHLDLGEWVFENDEWRAWYEVVDPDDADRVAAEAESQLERFRELVGRDPTHLDSHQHVHRRQPVRGALAAIGRRLGVPVRHLSAGVMYSGAFYGMTGRGEPFHEAITEGALADIVGGLPEGVTELGCHPGEPDGSRLIYDAERSVELAALCAPSVMQTVKHAEVTLVSFHDLATTVGSEQRTAQDRASAGG